MSANDRADLSPRLTLVERVKSGTISGSSPGDGLRAYTAPPLAHARTPTPTRTRPKGQRTDGAAWRTREVDGARRGVRKVWEHQK